MPEPQTTASDTSTADDGAGDGDGLRAWEPPVIRILSVALTEEGGQPGSADSGTFVS